MDLEQLHEVTEFDPKATEAIVPVTNSYTPEEATEIGFIPHVAGIVVYTPPVDSVSDSGIDLSLADSLQASYPVRGKIVARGEWVGSKYQIGTEVLVRRYVGIQMEVNGDPNYWYFDVDQGQVLGRFETD